MKILLIHNFYRFRGGEDRYVGILEETLQNHGHQVITFLYDSKSIGEFNLFKKCLIPLHLLHYPSANRELDRLVKSTKPDLAVVHNLSPLLSLSLLRVLKRNGIPVLKRLENYKFLCLNGLFLLTGHKSSKKKQESLRHPEEITGILGAPISAPEDGPLGPSWAGAASPFLRNDFTVCEACKGGNFFPGVRHRCYQRSFFMSLGVAIPEYIHYRLKTVIKCTDQFIATSEFVKKKFLEAGFPADKILVQPNFLDFDPLDAAVPPGDYAIYLGRLSREKGLLTLLEAFKHLPGLPLKILGEGPMEKDLKEFVRRHRLENLSFEGFVDGVRKRELLKKALFLIFPSECCESFGYTIIESFACGVPVVASDIGGARELVHEGITGFLFEVGSPGDLREKISRVMADRENLSKMKENALAQAKALYTRETGYQNLVRVFENLVR